MANKTITERLQPSLLDRLTDNEPESKVETRDDRVIDLRRLRDIIRRDLAWLLNSNSQDTLIDAEQYPNISNSVLNFGVREVAGDYSTEKRAIEIRKSIKRAIIMFEPRIKEGTLEVVARKDQKSSLTVIEFDIHADMWAQPLPMELYMRSQIDLTTGQLSLESVG
ncbi:type VI secretion system baseplate subunit TssE [Pseudosulfitobacter sp. SM2401]|jgi:type VI secretion system protein ImpF|uniref:type VI secretion system baseplate subunit TssE n=1 Tax=Pseudosulfitobacter sp. SM2401 TaxID=3350098 RepID=UPI0036F3F3C9